MPRVGLRASGAPSVFGCRLVCAGADRVDRALFVAAYRLFRRTGARSRSGTRAIRCLSNMVSEGGLPALMQQFPRSTIAAANSFSSGRRTAADRLICRFRPASRPRPAELERMVQGAPLADRAVAQPQRMVAGATERLPDGDWLRGQD